MKNRLIKLLLIIPLIVSCNKEEVDENKGWTIGLDSYTVSDTLEHVEKKECKVILLYGQSNATGYSISGYIEDNDKALYDKYDNGFSNVKINYIIEGNPFYTNNQFVDLKLENINNYYTFGPEMGIGEKYSETYQEEDIFIIKYAWGGSSLTKEWLTVKKNRNIMYQNAINFTTTNLYYLKSIGYDIHIEGICWMQGEADSVLDDYNNYYNNLTKLVSYFRNDLSSYQSSIRFVDAFIEDIDIWTEYKKINKQKLDFANSDSNNYLVDTITLGLTTNLEPTNGPDIAHYDSMSMVTLGREFANKMINKD